MRSGTTIRRLALLTLGLLLLASCAPRDKTAAETTSLPGSLGVAAFTQATHGSELLGGSIPEWAGPVDPQVLSALDRALQGEVVAARGDTFTEYQVVRRCQEIEDTTGAGLREPLEYWLAVGRCANVDFLLVPQLTALRTKDIAREQPAAVAFELSLVDVSGQRLVKRFHFEEAQQFLTDDILKLGKFLKRGGKWITAEDLATEGFHRAVKELWL